MCVVEEIQAGFPFDCCFHEKGFRLLKTYFTCPVGKGNVMGGTSTSCVERDVPIGGWSFWSSIMDQAPEQSRSISSNKSSRLIYFSKMELRPVAGGC